MSAGEQIVSTGNERDAGGHVQGPENDPDSIRITIDRDLPDEWVAAYHDPETGAAVPGRYRDMSDRFRIIAEYRHEACDRIHGVTVEGRKSLVDGWPEMMDSYLEATRNAVLRAVEECER